MDDKALIATGCVALNLRRAARVVTRKYEEAIRPWKLTSFQFSLLMALTDSPGAPQSAVAKGFGMDISTMNRNVQPMVRRGLVVVTPDAKDQRLKRMTLTEDGAALFEEAFPAWAKVQRDFLDLLGADTWPDIWAKLKTLQD